MRTSRAAELLAFEGSSHDALQVPKGIVKLNEMPRDALVWEIAEESGLDLSTISSTSRPMTGRVGRRNGPSATAARRPSTTPETGGHTPLLVSAWKPTTRSSSAESTF